jgi:hypothetical protein
VVVASSNGTLSASTSVTGLVDTLTLSTRAWRQKGDDSLGAIIATKGSGTVTSVATGYGLSGGTITTTGTLLVDTLNISTRAWRQKGLDSLAALEVSGSGTTNYIPKFTAGSTIGNSQIFDNGTSVGIGTASPNASYLVEAVKNGDVIFNLRTTSATGNPYIRAQSTTTNVYSAGIAQSTGTSAPFVNDGAFQYTNGAGGMQIITGTATPIQYFTNNTERLRITSGGDVGIGTTAPNTKTEIFGGDARVALSAVTTSTFRGYQMATGTTEFASLKAEAALGELRLTSGFAGFGGFTTFYNNGSERMRIFSNGRVGINTTTDAGYQLDVNGSIRASGLIRSQAAVGNTLGYFQLDHPGAQTWKIGVFTDNTSTFSIGNDNGGTFASRYLNITNSGNVGIGTTTAGRKLHVQTADGTASQIQIGQSYQRDYYIGIPASQTYFDFYDASAGASRMVISSAGNVGIGTASPGQKFTIQASSGSLFQLIKQGSDEMYIGYDVVNDNFTIQSNNRLAFHTGASFTERMRVDSAGEVLINTTTDAGDYKLQVSGNARIGTGKLDISSNTAFSMNVQRSGTSEVAGTFNNSNAILYLGAESSAGGAIFTGSSSYAAVIGSGANYPLQFATNNVTRATINTNGELLINTTTDNGDFKLQVNGNALISGSIKTANGASSTAQPWHLGSVVATNVQLDTANYVEVEINGVFYRLAIVTPL